MQSLFVVVFFLTPSDQKIVWKTLLTCSVNVGFLTSSETQPVVSRDNAIFSGDSSPQIIASSRLAAPGSPGRVFQLIAFVSLLI